MRLSRCRNVDFFFVNIFKIRYTTLDAFVLYYLYFTFICNNIFCRNNLTLYKRTIFLYNQRYQKIIKRDNTKRNCVTKCNATRGVHFYYEIDEKSRSN